MPWLTPATHLFGGADLRRLLAAATLLLISVSSRGGREASRDPDSSDAAEAVPTLDSGKVMFTQLAIEKMP
jgi:hypothetical protein